MLIRYKRIRLKITKLTSLLLLQLWEQTTNQEALLSTINTKYYTVLYQNSFKLYKDNN